MSKPPVSAIPEAPPQVSGQDPSSDVPIWDPEVGEALYEALYVDGLDRDALAERISGLEEAHGDGVLPQLLYLLSHLRLEIDEARRSWDEIQAHAATMEEKLGSPVDLRVALVSYFLNVNRKLRNPKIIELKLFEQTRASVYRDELTGLYNYRFLSEVLRQEVLRAERYHSPLSVVMADIDDFKALNDRHGHEAGNAVLAAVGGLVSGSLRRIDLAARYGGEEIVLVLPQTPKVGARLVAERVRQRIEQFAFEASGATSPLRVTASLGVATYPADARDAAELLRRADRALYLAKASGKNQVQLYGHSCRSFRRITASVGGRFFAAAGESYPVTTLDLSEGGVLFVSERRVEPGTLVDVTLDLPGRDVVVSLTGRVISSAHHDLDQFETAVQTLHLNDRDRVTLGDYLRQIAPVTDADDPERKMYDVR